MKSGPGYGNWSKFCKKETQLFGNMQQRCRTGYSSTEFSWDEPGFSDFIAYIGPIPSNMEEPSLGRKDHSKGYVKGNIFWQDIWENRAEDSKSGRARVGKIHSNETKALIGNINSGRKCSEETRALMSKSAKAGWQKRRNGG